MTKITIEIDSNAATQGTVHVEAPAGGATAPVAPASWITPPPDVAAEAARTGAINAGPAPALGAVGPIGAPIATSVGGAQLEPHQQAASAGPAPGSTASD
jgi:hypothetical protein